VAQATGGTSLVANWEAASRVVAIKVEMQWDGANWVDETSRVLAAAWGDSLLAEREGLPLLGQTPPAQASLELDNNDGRYSPDVAGSMAQTHYPNGIWDLPVQISAGFYDGVTAELLRQFTGRAYHAQELESTAQGGIARRVMMSLWDESAPLRQLKRTTEMYIDQRPDEIMDTELTAAAVASYSLDIGMGVIPWAWLDEENLWEQLSEIAAADGGWLRATKEGETVFERVTHWLEGTDHTSSQASVTTGRAWRMEDAINHKDLYSEVVVAYTPRTLGALDTVYSAREAIEVPPGETVERVCRYQVPALYVISPVVDTDYTALRAGGTDARADLTVSMTDYANQATIELTNANANHAVWVLNLKLRGYPVDAEDEEQVSESSGAGEISGDKIYRLSHNDYLQTKVQADRLAGFLRDRLGRYRRLWGFECVLAPWLEVGDRVTLTNAEAGIDEDAYLVQYEASYRVGQMLLMRGVLLPVENLFGADGYFVIGTSATKDAGSDPLFY